jgi:serine/threonine protein kinase
MAKDSPRATTSAGRPSSPVSAAGRDPDLGRVVAGAYRLCGLLGRGGMARVFEADPLDGGPRVALKLVHAELCDDPVVLARFDREARAAAEVAHPNVVGVHAIGRDADGVPFLVLELVRGPTLFAVLQAERQLAVARACDLARQLLEALDAVHARGVVHRDLKPENVLLAPTHAGGERLKLCDFGIATLVEARRRLELTPLGRVMATPHYASPEQLGGARGDHPGADLYAVAVMLYEMLAGRRPFEAPALPALIERVRSEEPAPLRVHRRDVPEALDALIARGLAKDPSQRPPTARAWRDALRDAQRR